MFDKLLALSEEVHAATKNTSYTPSVLIIRSAWSICPTCLAKDHGANKWYSELFFVDQFPDRAYLMHKIIPELLKRHPKEILWVGVQPYAMRYE